MTTKFTPGPWKSELLPERCIIYHGREVGSQTVKILAETPHDTELDDANATLMAAAPDLFAVAVKLNAELNTFYGIFDDDEGGSTLHDELRAVIARATKL